jgi:hypothetical protein
MPTYFRRAGLDSIVNGVPSPVTPTEPTGFRGTAHDANRLFCTNLGLENRAPQRTGAIAKREGPVTRKKELLAQIPALHYASSSSVARHREDENA